MGFDEHKNTSVFRHDADWDGLKKVWDSVSNGELPRDPELQKAKQKECAAVIAQAAQLVTQATP